MSSFPNLPLIIEPQTLQDNLSCNDLILVDLGLQTRYNQAHIPSARLVQSRQTQNTQGVSPGFLPDLQQLHGLFQQLGHRQDAVYVVYDDEGGGWAGRFIWILDCIGHKHYHYLNGGLHAWSAEKRPLSADAPAPAQSSMPLRVTTEHTADAAYILNRLGALDLALWDTRSPEEYRGERLTAARPGHLPGAIHLEWTQCMDPQRSLRLREDLAQLLVAHGITPDREIIAYCQSHHRSGLAYLVAKALNYPKVKAYAGSWSEWGNRTDLPVEA